MPVTMPVTIAVVLADPPLTGPAVADLALPSSLTPAGIGVLASVASGVGYGAANLVGGLAARRQPVLLTIACSQSVTLLLVAIVAATRPGRPSPIDLGIGVAAGAAAFTGDTSPTTASAAARSGPPPSCMVWPSWPSPPSPGCCPPPADQHHRRRPRPPVSAWPSPRSPS